MFHTYSTWRYPSSNQLWWPHCNRWCCSVNSYTGSVYHDYHGSTGNTLLTVCRYVYMYAQYTHSIFTHTIVHYNMLIHTVECEIIARFIFRIFHYLIQFAKVYSRNCQYQNTNVKYQHTDRKINTAKCLFEREIMKCLFKCEIAKYSSTKHFHYTAHMYVQYNMPIHT